LRWKAGATAKQPICCAAHREVCDDFGDGATAICQTPALPKSTLSPQKCPSRVRYKAEIGPTAGNKRPRGRVGRGSGKRRFKNPSEKDDQPMTTSSRFALGVSAALVSLSLALAPTAFAQDKMGNDAMKTDSMSKDSMSKDAMKKDDGMKKDGMMKNDAMKKDDGMKKN
jgi:pentapeptide MXKDX repeat protein